MNEKQEKANINLNIDPNKTPVLMVDTYVIGSNEHIVTLNFAQAFLASPQQNIVARVAMTRAQAKDFLKNLNDHIEKFEV